MEYAIVVVIVLVAALVLARRAMRAGKRTFDGRPSDPCATGCERCPVHDVTGAKDCGSPEASEEPEE